MRKTKYILCMMQGGEDVFQVEAEMPFGTVNKGNAVHVDNIAGFAASNIHATISEIEHMFYAVNEQTFVQLTRVILAD